MLRIAIIILVLAASSPAAAAVTISFYSREAGIRFPHAFFTLTGALETDGAPVFASFGFTTRQADLFTAVRPVEGLVAPVSADFVDRSTHHFSLVLSDDEYVRVLERVGVWQAAPQPSYHLDSANCVYFVADIAGTLGLAADPVRGLMLKPKRYLEDLHTSNAGLIAARGAPEIRTATASDHALATD